MIKNFERKPINWQDLIRARPQRPSIDDMARGRFFDAEAHKRRCGQIRSIYSESTRGYSQNRLNRHAAQIPYEFIVHPEFKKYFQPGMDKKERQKHLRKFLQMFPAFKL